MRKIKIPDLVIPVLVSLSIAAVGYSIQFIIFNQWFNNRSNVFNQMFRCVRMFVGYIIPSILYLKHTNQSISSMGLSLYKGRQTQVMSLIGGISLYLVPSYIFASFEIFTRPWNRRPWELSLILLTFIGLMAAITDLWTRGFLLLQVEEKYGMVNAIIIQNIVWFVIHIYEIVILVPYIGVWGAISLTIFLGIGGDLIAIKTKNVSGLMIGHVILNLAILLQGKGILNL